MLVICYSKLLVYTFYLSSFLRYIYFLKCIQGSVLWYKYTVYFNWYKYTVYFNWLFCFQNINNSYIPYIRFFVFLLHNYSPYQNYALIRRIVLHLTNVPPQQCQLLRVWSGEPTTCLSMRLDCTGGVLCSSVSPSSYLDSFSTSSVVFISGFPLGWVVHRSLPLPSVFPTHYTGLNPSSFNT